MNSCIKPGTLFPAIIALLVLLSTPSDRFACDGCQQPRVAIFDCRVIPPRPADTNDAQLAQKIIDWRELFWAAAGVKTVIFNNDPTKECFSHIDGAFFTQGDTASRGISFGPEWSNLPPPSGTAAGDYLITGSVDGSSGAYTVTAQIQVSKTREVVSGASISFTQASGAFDAGKSAAQTLGPVVDKIRLFEKSKRATGDPYALQPTAELHPQKTTANKGESVEVEIWLYDCDGDIATSPLANRPVQLTVTGGTISPSTVTTGSDGKAVATFTAGNTAMEALLQAAYPFKLASDYESVSDGGDASIKITAIPSTLWKVSGTIYNRTEYDETSTSSYTGFNGASHQQSSSENNFTLNAVIRNITQDSLTLFKSDSVPLSMRITGSHYENEVSNGYSVLTHGWTKDMSYQTVTCTPIKSTETANDVFFSFFYSPYTNRLQSYRTFSIAGWDMKGPAYTREQNCDSENGCEENTIDDEAEAPIEAYIGGVENDTGYRRDTSYVDGAGIRWTISEIKWIKKIDESFMLHSFFSQEVVSTTGGQVAATQYTSRTERLYDFLISPLDGPQKTGTIHLAPRAQGYTGLNASIKIRGDQTQIRYTAPENGTLTVKLYCLNGRHIYTSEFPASMGNHFQTCTVKGIYQSGVVCADLTITTIAGKVYRQTVKVNTVQSALTR